VTYMLVNKVRVKIFIYYLSDLVLKK